MQPDLLLDSEVEYAVHEAPPVQKPVAKRSVSHAAAVRPAPVAATPMEMLAAAVSSGANIDLLERLMRLNEQWEAAQAKKAYYEAKAAFKLEVPEIIKDMENKQYQSQYASIGNVVNVANKFLAKHGLDAKWEIDQRDKITVTCILTHSMGHSESAQLIAPPDGSGSKNAIQQIKSTLTYLRLATFEAVTGIATKAGNVDDDGNSAAPNASGPITEDQANTLHNIIEACKADKIRFCRAFDIEGVPQLKSSDFNRALAMLSKFYGDKQKQAVSQ